MKTVMKIVLGVVIAGILLIGGCAVVVGGALSSVDSDDKTAAERATEDREARKSSTKAAKPTKTKSEQAEPEMNPGQENAIAKAEQYLQTSAFSRSGLVDQLKFEGFSEADATFAVDNLKPDWNEQAAAKAEQYLSTSAFSRDGLIDQLKFEGFTPEQAAYGVKQAGL